METDRRDIYRCGTEPLITAFRRQSQEPCEFKASQNYTVRLEGRKEGGEERREGGREKGREKYKKIKQAKAQTNRIYSCSFKQTNALFKFSSLPKIPARSSCQAS